MPNFILDDKFNFNGLDIAYKVSGTNSPGKQPIFILALQTLSFSSRTFYPEAEVYSKWKKDTQLPDANFIFVDNPGSGNSSKPSDPSYYNIDFFTQTMIAAVEEVKRKLNVKKMQLFIEAGSDSSLVAMNVLKLKPEWANETSDIQVRMIINRYGQINGDSGIDYIKKHCSNDPNLPDYIDALTRLDNGDIKDNIDLTKNVNAKLAPLEMDTNDLEYKALGKYVLSNPERALDMVKSLKKVTPTQKMEKYLDLIMEVIAGCNIECLNHLSKTSYSNIDIKQIVRDNYSVYSKVPIIYLGASEDVLAPLVLNSYQLQSSLPNNLLTLSFVGKPYDTVDQSKSALKAIYSGQLADKYTISNEFKQHYDKLKNEILAPASQLKSKSSTGLHGFFSDVKSIFKEHKEHKSHTYRH